MLLLQYSEFSLVSWMKNAGLV